MELDRKDVIPIKEYFSEQFNLNMNKKYQAIHKFYNHIVSWMTEQGGFCLKNLMIHTNRTYF